jgi:hypothetical protein
VNDQYETLTCLGILIGVLLLISSVVYLISPPPIPLKRALQTYKTGQKYVLMAVPAGADPVEVDQYPDGEGCEAKRGLYVREALDGRRPIPSLQCVSTLPWWGRTYVSVTQRGKGQKKGDEVVTYLENALHKATQEQVVAELEKRLWSQSLVKELPDGRTELTHKFCVKVISENGKTVDPPRLICLDGETYVVVFDREKILRGWRRQERAVSEEEVTSSADTQGCTQNEGALWTLPSGKNTCPLSPSDQAFASQCTHKEGQLIQTFKGRLACLSK